MTATPDFVPSSRSRALDLLRGLALAGMLVVNNQGDWSHVYPALRHATWNGVSGADLVFPFFLFAVGGAIPFALESRRARGASRAALARAIVRRAAVLAALGLALNLFPHFDGATVRIPGVLQRIACCYCLAALLALATGTRGRILATALVLAGYWLALWLGAPPGHPLPDLPVSGTLPHRIDAWLFAGHTYAHAPAPGFDPEGLLSTAGALATTLMGLVAGQWYRDAPATGRRALRLFGAGLAFTAAGLAAHAVMPINKNLWTPSYALLMAGLALAALAAGAAYADAGGQRRGTVLLAALGRNALVLYLVTSVTARALAFIPVSTNGSAATGKALAMGLIRQAGFAPPLASLCYALFFLAAGVLLAWHLDRRRIYVTL